MYRYPCPGCRTTNAIHREECGFQETSRSDIEKTHIDIISVLSIEPRTASGLKDAIDDEWDTLHKAVLTTLINDVRVEKHADGEEDDPQLELIPPGDRADRVEPTEDPIRTVYEHGSVPGAHDNSIFALIAYYESQGLSWEDTKEKILSWLQETGTWERGGFEEATPEELVEKKQHVHDRGYGWNEKAHAAKTVIEASGRTNT